ncbi:hypothetical protein G8770_21130 [Aestuariicella hydrocarbonica]|uniref:Uncharacterized protein n=1 Tax=Pseudomaricurvus hydrocarbonicus TaxID=1470433 RepID=A0A9E5T4K7_9GAMM|nr:DUF6763 family protein [Aestuariicella hydrocarbonica]NHO68059.1 hypothetical protein [Aestuariicella hydrocarbonica]
MAFATPGQRATIGEWYQDVVENIYFEVVAVDEQSGSIEIQYLDGSVSEIEMDQWAEMALVPASPPEDADAAYELSMPDNSWNNDSTQNPGNWNNPLNYIEPDLFQGSDDF